MQDWYLIKAPYAQLSGYENEAFDDYATEGFEEALESSLGIDVELINPEMTQSTAIRAIVTGNLQDTKLNDLSRKLLTPIGTVTSGWYIKYKNRYWIIVSIVDDNGVYDKCVMVICNYLLTWLNDNNEIVQRWTHVTSASQYNNGETSTTNYYVRSDQLMIVTPDDDESMSVHQGQRFIIDKRTGMYEKRMNSNVDVCTENDVIVYQLTRLDTVLYNYQGSGHSEFMAYQTEKGTLDGFYKIGGKGYWICVDDENQIKEIPSALTSRILYEEDVVWCGLDSSIFYSEFYDSNGSITRDVDYTWRIDADFADKLIVESDEDAIYIATNDKALIGKSFKLYLEADGYETVSEDITVRAFF